MKIVKIIGGLGNQMFQYAFAYALSRKSSDMVKLDVENFSTYDLRQYELDLYNISLQIATKQEVDNAKYKKESYIKKLLRKLKKKSKPFSEHYYKETSFHFNENALGQEDRRYFEGYWQSERYFKEYRKNLLKEFTLKNTLHEQSKVYQNQIGSCNAVSLHVRRGDYVSNPHTNSVHGTCTLEYYKNAVRYLEGNTASPHFFIFSDDLAWAEENLQFIKTKTFVELDENVPDHEEMQLMSLCRHNIIANSSFSWWGAWLNQNKDKIVIAPSKWFNDNTIDTKDLIPKEWIRL